jgi:hypothetical protein
MKSCIETGTGAGTGAGVGFAASSAAVARAMPLKLTHNRHSTTAAWSGGCIEDLSLEEDRN